MSITTIGSIVIIIALQVLPGAAITLALPRRLLRGLRWSERIAIGIALGPLLASATALLVHALGGNWTVAACVPALEALVGAVLLWRTRPRHAFALRGRRVPVALAAVLTIVLACVLVPWMLRPEFREVSFHGLMHADFAYAVWRSPLHPEEPLLAGVALHYPWLGHAHLALLGWTAAMPPTQVALIVNCVMLLTCGYLAYRIARRIGLSAPAAALSAAFMLLATNIIGETALALKLAPEPDALDTLWPMGRYSPMLIKFRSMNLMPMALALLCAIVLVCVAELRRRRVRFAPELISVLVACVGALYPPLLPSAVAAVAALALTLLVARRRRRGGAWWARLVLGMFVAGVISAVALRIYSDGAGAGGVGPPSLRGVLLKAAHVVIAFGPLGLAAGAAWMIARGSPMRSPSGARGYGAAMVLVLMALAGAGMYIALRVNAMLEYKSMFMPAIALAPFAAALLDRVVRRAALRSTIACIVTAVLAIPYLIARMPPALPDAPHVHANGFHLDLEASAADAEWMRDIRLLTPTDAIVLLPPDMTGAHASTAPLSPFLDRALFAPPISSTEPSPVMNGYLPDPAENLRLRGASADVLEGRRTVLEWIFADVSPIHPDSLWLSLAALDRPIVIVADKPTPFLRFLELNEIGTNLRTEPDARPMLWLISRDDLP